MGWTSNRGSGSKNVFSPFRAAKATFAFDAEECVRRDLLVIELSCFAARILAALMQEIVLSH